MRTIPRKRSALVAVCVSSVARSSCAICRKKTPRMVEVRTSGESNGFFHVFCAGCVAVLGAVSGEPIERPATTPTVTREGVLS